MRRRLVIALAGTLCCGTIGGAIWRSRDANAKRAGSIVTHDPLDRTDVPHHRAHVLDATTLEPLREEDTDLNVTVFPTQALPGQDHLIASSWSHRERGPGRKYVVSASNHFVREAGEAPAEPGPRFTVDPVAGSYEDWEIRRDGHAILPFKWRLSEGKRSSSPPQLVHVYNGGRSLLISSFGSLVVPDVDAPKLLELPGLDLQKPILSKDGRSYVALTMEPGPNRSWVQHLTRIDAEGRVTSSAPFEPREGSDLFDEIVALPEIDRLVVTANSQMQVHDALTLERVSTIHVPNGAGVRGVIKRPEGPWLMAGGSLVDLNSGTVKASIEGLVRAGSVLVTDEAIYWAGQGSQPSGYALNFTRLHRFDVSTLRESAARDLDVGKPTGDEVLDGTISARAIYRLSGNRLLVLSGTEVVFMDHDHLPEP